MVKKHSRFRWRDYKTAAGERPVRAFLDTLNDEELASVVAGMKEVSEYGLSCARHLRGEIYEVRADAERRAFRVLFAQETKFILLAIAAFPKTTRKTPPAQIDLADSRLASWRKRK